MMRNITPIMLALLRAWQQTLAQLQHLAYAAPSAAGVC
jgi:hypothetical protein